MMTIAPPQSSEFNAFYAGYIGKVPASGPLPLLHGQLAAFAHLGHLPDTAADYRYADGKWSVKEVLVHMADTERVFAYRLLHVTRGDPAPLAGMDEKQWLAAAPHRHRRIVDVAAELVAVRRATIALVESLNDEALARTGTANSFPISARALCWILPGHAQHHLDVLQERYRLAARA